MFHWNFDRQINLSLLITWLNTSPIAGKKRLKSTKMFFLIFGFEFIQKINRLSVKRGGNYGHILTLNIKQAIQFKIKFYLTLYCFHLLVMWLKIFFWDGPYTEYQIECWLEEIIVVVFKQRIEKESTKAILLIWFYAAWKFKYKNNRICFERKERVGGVWAKCVDDHCLKYQTL